MNIETLRVFCDVVQHQSFSRGAKINDMSQSAATQAVHRVEEHFGVQLVDRSKRPFVLTPEGQACYEGFREVLELYDSVESKVRSLRQEIGGLVRVAAIYSVGLHDMSRCMQDFMRQYPKAKVRLEYLRPNKVYDAVLNGEVDIGIVSYPAASPDLNVIALRSERMVIVCPPGHRLASHGAVTAEQLEGVDIIGFDRDLSIRKEIDRHLRQRSVAVHVSMEFDNIETIKQAVQIGAGVSILPEPTIREEVRAGTLVGVRLIAPELRRPLGIIHRQRRVFAPTVAKFVELLQQVQSQEPGDCPDFRVGENGTVPLGREMETVPLHAVKRERP
jgi:DNA-binding transcriptional LysR family regulator